MDKVQLLIELKTAKAEVERLRKENNDLRGLHEVHCTRGDGIEETMTWVCAECERLRAEVERLVKRCEEAREQLMDWADDIPSVKRWLGNWP